MKSPSPFLLLCVLALSVFAQGPLTPPPGAPAPTMKTLDQVEARTIINSANTPGDASSSFIISAPGSYYLTGNITGVAGKHGITIAASEVTFNLNGFAVTGVPGSSLNGINVSGVRANISVLNGSVSNWGGDGVSAASARNSQYRDLRLAGNTLTGLNAGVGSSVLNCTARINASSGISVGLGSTVTGCTAQENFQHGFSTDSGVTVTGCSAYLNQGRGINVGDSCTVTDCTVRSNTTDGIVTGNDCNINHCTIRRNDGKGIFASTGNVVNECTVSFNGSDGIIVESDCLITKNNCRQNGRLGSGIGIHVVTGGSANRIEENNCTNNNNAGFFLESGGNILIRNTARGNGGGLSNYITASGNTIGPVLSASDPITSNNPWANFSY